jgi:SagB-type dehydrogenase family enzyme
LRAPGKKRSSRNAPLTISVRLNGRIVLQARADGGILACFDGHSVSMGKFSIDTAKRAQDLRSGLPLASVARGRGAADRELALLVRRLAERGLLEYSLGTSGRDQVVIEPQMADYWPRTPKLAASQTLVLSRFAYLRRRGDEMVLESPRAGALFRISDPEIAAGLGMLCTPQKISTCRRHHGFPGLELLSLLVDCNVLLKTGAAGNRLRLSEGDENLVLWDFHDLLFHARSTEGRQANPLGGLYPYADLIRPPAAVRPRWPGKQVDLRALSTKPSQPVSPLATLLRERHSTRDFDDQQPITLGQLAHFLEHTARIRAKWKSKLDASKASPEIAYTTRPYPSGGSAYELELYLAVRNCEGLESGFYHYDADRHALVPIGVRSRELEATLAGAEFAMGTEAPPQVLMTIAARFSRVSWKYSSVAYSLILKDVGVLLQTLYLMATDMGLGGCAIGTNNIDLFAKMTGIEFHVEGPVGQFALGRGRAPRGGTGGPVSS